MAVAYNIYIDQGADWFFNVTYENPAGTPVDLTNYTAALQVRSLPQSVNYVLSLTTGSGITIVGPQGLVEMHATAAQTGVISEGDYYYDLEITSQTGIVTRLVQGQAIVSAQVTR